MNVKKFSDAMSELDTKYVDEALNYKKKAPKPIWVKWGAIAACLCLKDYRSKRCSSSQTHPTAITSSFSSTRKYGTVPSKET